MAYFPNFRSRRFSRFIYRFLSWIYPFSGASMTPPLSFPPDGVFRHALRSCRKLRFSNRWSNPRKALHSCKHDGELSEALTAVLDYYVGIIIPGGFICQIFCVEFCVTKLRRNCMHRIPKKHRQPAPHLRGTRPPSMSPIIN